MGGWKGLAEVGKMEEMGGKGWGGAGGAWLTFHRLEEGMALIWTGGGFTKDVYTILRL